MVAIMATMAISGDYSSPVTVNGFSCRNCSDVDRAKRNIDPANPSAGPFGINDHSKAGAAKNHFSPEARQQGTMEALHKVHSRPAVSAAAAAYGGAAGISAGQFVAISA